MQKVIVTTPLELRELIKESIADVMLQIPIPKPSIKQDSDLITRSETAKLLGVALSTLDLWVKQGRLQKYRINSTVRFKRNEVLEAFQTFHKYKR